MRAERCQPLHKGVDLFGAIRAARSRGGEIDVNPVLNRLGVRNPLEEHPGPYPGGIFDREGSVECPSDRDSVRLTAANQSIRRDSHG